MASAGPSNQYPEPEFRPRRPHTKSRNGCDQCKQQRKKCDEGKPQCTRCAERMLPCTYATERYRYIETSFDKKHESTKRSPARSQSSRSGRGSPTDTEVTTSPPRSWVPPPNLPQAQFQGSQQSHSETNRYAHALHQLDPDLTLRDVELFNHYMLHTRYTLPADARESYGLRIGIPNLAIQSRPLMHSIIAMAAVCKCQDALDQGPTVSCQQLVQVKQLLDLADHHHEISMQLIQIDIATTTHYNAIIAHAIIMSIYSLAVHSVRIRLDNTTGIHLELPIRYMPVSGQWMGHIKGISMAYIALHDTADDSNDIIMNQSIDMETLQTEPIDDYMSGSRTPSPKNDMSSMAGQHLCPVVASTGSSAVVELRSKALRIGGAGYMNIFSSHGGLPEMSLINNDSDYQACMASLDVLNNVLDSIFQVEGSSPSSSIETLQFVEIPQGSRLQRVEPWLRDFCVPNNFSGTPKTLRRAVMSFVNRVPLQFWTLVSGFIERFSFRVESSEWIKDSSGSPKLLRPPMAALAMDIYAHWLVLVVLLDGVWWLDGVGAWELRRAISCLHNWEEFGAYRGMNKEWWPETMLELLDVTL